MDVYSLLHILSQSIRAFLLLSASATAIVSASGSNEGRIRLSETSDEGENSHEEVEREEQDDGDWERMSTSTAASDDGDESKKKKKGGKNKKKKVPFTFANVTRRLYRLAPFLWPSKSYKLQICAALSLACTLSCVAFSLIEPLLWGRIVQSLSERERGCHICFRL